MKTNNLFLIALLFLSPWISSAQQKDMTEELVKSGYNVTRDVAFGPGAEQVMDLYINENLKQKDKKNFTVIFLHGGGYYISDKTKEERYIQPYLKKGFNVINMNFRLKKGIPIATEDLTIALNFLQANNSAYQFNLNRVILTGFSAGANIASTVGASMNNPAYPNKVDSGIKIAAVINFSGPVDGLDVVEKVFTTHEMPMMSEIGRGLFPSDDYAPEEVISVYEPITYFDKNDPPFFVWYGGKDDQVPPVTFEKFVALLNENKKKNVVVYCAECFHSPKAAELESAYQKIFSFIDGL